MGYLNKILSKKLFKAKSMTNLPDFTVLLKKKGIFSRKEDGMLLKKI